MHNKTVMTDCHTAWFGKVPLHIKTMPFDFDSRHAMGVGLAVLEVR